MLNFCLRKDSRPQFRHRMSPKTILKRLGPERLSTLISGVLRAKVQLTVVCIGGSQKAVHPGLRVTRPLEEFTFYFAEATLFLRGKYAPARVVPRFQRSPFKVKSLKLLRLRSRRFVVERGSKLSPRATCRFISSLQVLQLRARE